MVFRYRSLGDVGEGKRHTNPVGAKGELEIVRIEHFLKPYDRSSSETRCVHSVPLLGRQAPRASLRQTRQATVQRLETAVAVEAIDIAGGFAFPAA